MSEAMAPVAADDPRMIAWNAYKQTEEYANTRKWAQCEEHVNGSLWAAFIAGFGKPNELTVQACVICHKPVMWDDAPEPRHNECAEKSRAAKAEAERDALAGQVAALREAVVALHGALDDEHSETHPEGDDMCGLCDLLDNTEPSLANTAAAADEYTKRIQAEAVANEDVANARELLWLNHGCDISALYSDDGEMQCGACRIDFRRESLEKIAKRLHQLAQTKAGWLDTERAARQAAEGRVAEITNDLRAVEANSRDYAQRIAQLEAALRKYRQLELDAPQGRYPYPTWAEVALANAPDATPGRDEGDKSLLSQITELVFDPYDEVPNDDGETLLERIREMRISKAERDAAVAAGRALELARDAALSRNAEAEGLLRETEKQTGDWKFNSTQRLAWVKRRNAFLANSNQPKPADAELTALRALRQVCGEYCEQLPDEVRETLHRLPSHGPRLRSNLRHD